MKAILLPRIFFLQQPSYKRRIPPEAPHVRRTHPAGVDHRARTPTQPVKERGVIPRVALEEQVFEDAGEVESADAVGKPHFALPVAREERRGDEAAAGVPLQVPDHFDVGVADPCTQHGREQETQRPQHQHLRLHPDFDAEK